MSIRNLIRHGRVSALLVLLALLAGTAHAQFRLLHPFAGGGSGGRNPYDSLTLSGSTRYGMTQSGGSSDVGTVFSFSLAPIAEPSTAVLLGTGLAGPLIMRRRRERLRQRNAGKETGPGACMCRRAGWCGGVASGRSSCRGAVNGG